MENQKQIDKDIHDRLTELEAQIHVLTAFALASVETHTAPAALRVRFAEHHKALHDIWANSRLTDEWIDSADGLHHIISSAFPRPIP